jgi:hypothetical protein
MDIKNRINSFKKICILKQKMIKIIIYIQNISKFKIILLCKNLWLYNNKKIKKANMLFKKISIIMKRIIIKVINNYLFFIILK